MAIDWEAMPPGQRSAARKLMPLCGYERVGDCEKAKRKQQGRDTNKTEKVFGEMLAILEIQYRIVMGRRNYRVFDLAGDTTYTPDFVVVDWADIIGSTYIEIKGFMRDDAAVKLKVAARLYPQYRWLLVKRGSQGQWKCFEVSAEKGIGRKPVNVEWMSDR